MAGQISGRTSRGPKADPTRNGADWALVRADQALEVRPFNQKLQELWLVLAQREWNSLAVVPAHGGGSATEIACSLADTGSSLTEHHVSAVTVNELGPGSARSLAALASDARGRNERRWQAEPFIDVTPGQTVGSVDGSPEAIVVPLGQIVISVPSVVAEPVSLTVVQAVDLVVLAVELGVTTMKEIRRSIELIGRERLIGCILY